MMAAFVVLMVVSVASGTPIAAEVGADDLLDSIYNGNAPAPVHVVEDRFSASMEFN